MKDERPHWRWEEGVVDQIEEHIELHHGNAAEIPCGDWQPIARISKPKDHLFIVEWLIKEDSLANQAVLAHARRELTFYLVEKEEPNPWAYAVYHCNTVANVYSSIHWSHLPDRRKVRRRKSHDLLDT